MLTAVCGTPKTLDLQGEVDLTFQRDEGGPHTWPFGERDLAAVEVKSLPGPWRKAESKMVIGGTYCFVVQTAADILVAATDKLVEAIARMGGKIQDSSWSKNVFLVIDPLDGLAIEALGDTPLIGHLLPDVSSSVDLDTLWVLWHPHLLAYWSRDDQAWTDIIFETIDPEDPQPERHDDDFGGALERAEVRYLAAIGYERSSPWLMTFSPPGDGGDPDQRDIASGPD